MAKKKTPAINSSSTADIAFLLLCYFLMTTTMGSQTGLQRRLPPMPSADQQVQDQKVNRRNIIVVRINSADRILAGSEAQNELGKAVNELRDEFARSKYGRSFNGLTEEQQDIVKKAVPQNISEAEPKDVAKK